jgi:hypothetical protein
MMVEDRLLVNIIPAKLRPYLGRLWYDWLDRRRLARAVALVPGILNGVQPPGQMPRLHDWVVRDARWSKTGAAVLRLGLPTVAPAAILKIAFTPPAAAGLAEQTAVLARLRAEPRLDDWCALLPRPLADGELHGLRYSLQTALPGVTASTWFAAGRAVPWRLLALTAEAIRPLHERTAGRIVFDDEFLTEAVDRPLALLRQAAPSTLLVGRADILARLARELHSVLVGREGVAGWIHGDLWLGNVLVAPDGSRVTGIVDWNSAAARELALHDALHLILYERQLAEKRELGDVVRAALERNDWEPRERDLLVQPLLAAGGLGERTAVLLYWLRRLRLTIEQGTGPAQNPVWVAWNIDQVLQCL